MPNIIYYIFNIPLAYSSAAARVPRLEEMSESIDAVEKKVSKYAEVTVFKESFERLREVQLYYPIRICENLLKVYKLKPSVEKEDSQE